MVNKSSFETGKISVMRGSRKVLVKVMHLQSRVRGHPQNDATFNFLSDCKCSLYTPRFNVY